MCDFFLAETVSSIKVEQGDFAAEEWENAVCGYMPAVLVLGNGSGAWGPSSPHPVPLHRVQEVLVGREGA